MTDEQRKAAVEKAARAQHRWWSYNAPQADERWANMCESARQLNRDQAEAALESVGYFELVDVVEAAQLAANELEAAHESAALRWQDGDYSETGLPSPEKSAFIAVRAALKKVQP